MDMLKINAGKLRAIGYDKNKRILRVELDNGSALEYAHVGDSIWHNLKQSSSPWSYYRDNIEEEFSHSQVSTKNTGPEKNPLDELFKS